MERTAGTVVAFYLAAVAPAPKCGGSVQADRVSSVTPFRASLMGPPRPVPSLQKKRRKNARRIQLQRDRMQAYFENAKFLAWCLAAQAGAVVGFFIGVAPTGSQTSARPSAHLPSAHVTDMSLAKQATVSVMRMRMSTIDVGLRLGDAIDPFQATGTPLRPQAPPSTARRGPCLATAPAAAGASGAGAFWRRRGPPDRAPRPPCRTASRATQAFAGLFAGQRTACSLSVEGMEICI